MDEVGAPGSKGRVNWGGTGDGGLLMDVCDGQTGNEAEGIDGNLGGKGSVAVALNGPPCKLHGAKACTLEQVQLQRASSMTHGRCSPSARPQKAMLRRKGTLVTPLDNDHWKAAGNSWAVRRIAYRPSARQLATHDCPTRRHHTTRIVPLPTGGPPTMLPRGTLP